ncbi:hypothetical protein [Egicoccus sp. AB-alg6-2]|uniref:hypothetical protein n=1 Tax=Egicoccus sp. AB-alg6-2 TaxID=3242692 RepID=UPI00359ED00E
MGTETAERDETGITPWRRWRRVLFLVLGALVGLALVVVVAFLLFEDQLVMAVGGASGAPVRPEPELQTAIEAAFEEAEGDDVVVLTDVIRFDWDIVGVFGPYTPHEKVVEQMGVRVPRGVTNNTALESSCLLVFRGGDRMVAWTTVGRNAAEGFGDEVTGVHSSDEARFEADSFMPVTSN